MKNRLIAAIILIAIAVFPIAGITEDVETVMLAKTLYALCRDESYNTMLNVGTVVMNRVDSAFFPGDIESVLNQTHQFARGNRYDERSLKAARELLNGTRTLPDFVTYFNELDEWSTKNLYASSGGYGFYTDDE